MKLAAILRNRPGAAMIELAIIMTMVSLTVLGAIDFGRIAYHAMALTNAARAGALHGAQPGNSTDFTGMRNAALNSAAQDIGAITVPTPTKSCECQVGAAAPTVMLSCTSACAGTIRARVRVSASKSFNPLIRFPGLPTNVTVTRVAIMRAQ